MAKAKHTTLAHKKRTLPGQRFGRLVVCGFESTRNGNHYWRCLCDCGCERAVSTTNLNNGHVKSCGCFKSDFHSTHRMSQSRAYKAWINMKTRCGNANTHYYKDYGERGIRVCDRWQSFEAFHEDMGDPPSRTHSIDRIENDGNYEPGNCRWATPTQQVRNRRNNIVVEYRGESKCLSEWAHLTGIPQNTLRYRLSHGWNADRAFTTRPANGRIKR